MTYRPILKCKEMRAQRQVPVVNIIIYFQKVLIWEERACACVRHVLPVGGCQEVKGTVAWKSANWRKRGRRTRTFKYLPFSSILSFVLLHTFLLNVLGEFLQGNEVCQITRTLSGKESVLGQGFTPTQPISSHKKGAPLCQPHFIWALVPGYRFPSLSQSIVLPWNLREEAITINSHGKHFWKFLKIISLRLSWCLRAQLAYGYIK